MKRPAIGVVTAVLLVLGVAGCGGDDDSGGVRDAAPSSSAPAVVADAEWCAGWQAMVQAQSLFVADPGPATTAALLELVDELQALGVPESLDPSGYTELTAVLDDVRASADPSFTATVVPSEPADVPGGHDHGDEGLAEDEHLSAPFGSWLADHCRA